MQVECYAEHETLGDNKKAFSHVIDILGGLKFLRSLINVNIYCGVTDVSSSSLSQKTTLNEKPGNIIVVCQW